MHWPNTLLKANLLRSSRMKFRQIWRTMRFRLAVMNALAVVAIALTTLAVVRQGVEWTLYRELDQLLIEDVHEVSLALRDSNLEHFSLLEDELERKSLGHREHGWFIILLDGASNPFWASDGAPAIRRDLEPTTSAVPFTQDGLRIVHAVANHTGEYQVNSVYVGAKLEFLKRDMGRIDRLVVMATGILAVLAPLSGYWLAGRAARTVGDIIHTASRLRPTRLDERLKLRGTDDELDQLSQTINGLLDRIADYLNKKRDFLANAAHELRTPLAAIRSSIEVALDGREMRTDERNLLEDLIDQANSLEVLVNQLLLITETEMGQWAYSPIQVQMHDVVTRATEMFQGVAEVSGIQLKPGQIDHAVVAGSGRYLRQVVNNLIDNAVKYTGPGGTIHVSLQVSPGTHQALLTVQDTGSGIAEEDVPRVFERFFRGDRSRGRQAAVHGTGLGLSICQAVVNAHGGTIECHSELGVGTSMIVALPLSTSDMQREQSHGDDQPLSVQDSV